AELRGDGMGPDQVIGMAAKTALRNGQALRTDDLIKPQIVQRNEAVTIYYEVPGIMLTVRGKAIEGGAMGDVVGVLNIQSNRTVQATVIGPGRVTIAAAGPLIASASKDQDPPAQWAFRPCSRVLSLSSVSPSPQRRSWAFPRSTVWPTWANSRRC